MGFSRRTPTLFKGFARRRFTTVTLWWRPLKTEASFSLCWRRRKQHVAQNISVFSLFTGSRWNIQEGNA